MGVNIHPTAIVHPDAVVGDGTTIGAFSSVGAGVKLGENCEIQEHVVLRGPTTIGREAKIFPFAVIGGVPQHLGFKGEQTTVEIGDRVVIRESVTIHRGTEVGVRRTVVGDDCYLMAYVHVAHDCIIGKKVILANAIQLAGHVEIGDSSTIGGQSAVAQFCRVGERCYVGGGSILRKDLPPFLLGKGGDFEVQGVNQVGLTRQGFSSDEIRQLKEAYKILYLQRLTTAQALEKITTELGSAPLVIKFVDFIKASKMGFHR